MNKQRAAFCVFLILVLLAAALPLQTLAAEEEEEEIAYTRIEISSAEEWLSFAQSCTLDAWSKDKEIVLTDDISLSGWDYEPIPSFGGRFLGGGHTVSGVSLRSSAAPTGLFGETQEGAEICDLKVSGTLAPTGDGSTVGGVVGKNRGLLKNCTFTGTVTGRSRTGGVVGLNAGSGVVDGCSMSGGVTGRSMTGGIVGRNDGIVRNCRNDGYINTDSADPSVNLDGLSLRGLWTAAEDNSLSLVNVATDTGGVCGYSTGTVAASRNDGAVGYPHIGYNVGGVVGRNVGLLDSCQNYGSVCGRRDIGGIVGQMEPYVELVLTEDMARTLQQQMNGLSYLLNETVKDAQSTSNASADRLQQIAQSFSPVLEAASSDDPTQISQQLGALTGSMAGVSSQLYGAADGIRQSAEVLAEDMQRVIGQLNAVNNTLSQAISDAGSSSVTDVLSDTSEENVDAVTMGKAVDCQNSGTVAGDINVGGVAGSLSLEVEMDPEGDSSGGISSLLHREYQMKAILQRCTNLGPVTSRKNCAGSVCGQMELGLIYGCYGYGSVESESGDYVGGVVGLTQGVVRSCWAKCTLRGGSFVGGVAGSGARNETTGAASMIAECRSMVDIQRVNQYAGAIAGGEDGNFSGNLFVSESLAGVNRLNRAGEAEPVSYSELLTWDGLPSRFRNLTLQFMAGDELVASRQFLYGESFSADVYPAIPEKEGFYGVWDPSELTNLRFDTVVNAVYLPAVSALQSEEKRMDKRPVFFVEGSFREEDALGAVQTTEDALESVTGGGESLLLSALRGDLTRPRNVSEQWTLTIPFDGSDTHSVRYLPEDNDLQDTIIYIRTDRGWQKADCGVFGSYLRFTVSGSEAELAAVHTQDAWWLVAVYALIALAAIALAAALLRALSGKRRTKNAGTSREPVVVPAPAEKPPRKLPRKKALGIGLGIAGALLLGILFLRSGVHDGLALYRMADALYRQEDANLSMSACVNLGESQFTTQASAFKTRVSEQNVFCLQQNGASIYYSGGTLYLENGAAFRVGELLPGRWEALKVLLGLHGALDIRSERHGEEIIYSVDTRVKDPGPLPELLFPTAAAKLEQMESFHADIRTINGQPEGALFTVSGTISGGTPLSLTVEVFMESPDPMGNAVPSAVKAAMKEPAGEENRVMNADLVRLLYGWAELNARETLAAELRLKAGFGALIVDDELRYCRGSADGITVHRVEDGGVSVYYADGKLCSEDGRALSLKQSRAETGARLLELACQCCMNGSFSCQEEDGGFTYTVSLHEEDMYAVMAAIAPESETLSLTPDFGSVVLRIENDRIRSLTIVGRAALSVALLETDADFSAEITVDESVASFPVPEAVLRALSA